jgi:hypothetical protein
MFSASLRMMVQSVRAGDFSSVEAVGEWGSLAALWEGEISVGGDEAGSREG